jgi:hypothetical protein
MTPNPLKPFYKYGPIQDHDTLAEVLELSRQQLERLAQNADRMYRPVPQKKKDGSARLTWDAFRQLKAVHQLIKVRILGKVAYPLYLQGGIRDRSNPRDHVRNAGIHAGQACVINEDIADFFPSTIFQQVRDIWEHFFRYSPEVARYLALLTTRRGKLPQGAKTSNHLANLVFWHEEHELVSHLKGLGWTYSRLADDLTVSFPNPVSRSRKSKVVSVLYAFVKRHGYQPKYRKHDVFDGNERMLVNNLVVNKHPALPKEECSAIRALVHRTVRQLDETHGEISEKSLAQVQGKLGKLKRLHGRAGTRLSEKLKNSLSRHRSPSLGNQDLGKR